MGTASAINDSGVIFFLIDDGESALISSPLFLSFFFSLIRSLCHVNIRREKLGSTSFMTLTAPKIITCGDLATSQIGGIQYTCAIVYGVEFNFAY